MELGSYFLFLQEQRKDIIIILNRAAGNWSNFERVSTYSLEHCISDCFRQRCHPLHSIVGPFECHSRSACTVWVVHCLHSGCNCRAFSAWESARSLPKLSGSSQCALTLTMNVRAPRTLSHTHSTIVVMMSAFASPVSVVRGLLPIHHDTHDTFWSAVSLSLWKIPFVFLRSIPHRSSLNTDISLGKRLLFLVFRVKRTGAWRERRNPGMFSSRTASRGQETYSSFSCSSKMPTGFLVAVSPCARGAERLLFGLASGALRRNLVRQGGQTVLQSPGCPLACVQVWCLFSEDRVW
jgi:hypothetical protein